jgi:hypothetical protein
LALKKSDEFERRSRLVSLAYEVLRKMKGPADVAKNMEVQLSQAFLDKATALRNVAGVEPKASRPKLSSNMYSMANRECLANNPRMSKTRWAAPMW